MSVSSSSQRRLIVESNQQSGLEGLRRQVAAGTTGIEALSINEQDAVQDSSWFSADLADAPAEHPWDQAHRSLNDPRSIGLEAAPAYAEPDLIQRFPYAGPDDLPLESFGHSEPCTLSGPDAYWPPLADCYSFAWHLDTDHSGLKAARDQVGDPAGRRIRIGILDTGYDPGHTTIPLHVCRELARNFAGGPTGDATDPGHYYPMNQPGHGTATMALLAGRRVQVSRAGHTFDDFLGGAPFAEIVPIRIADSVMHFQTSSMAHGIEYAIEAGCDVVSISMGGVPSRAWAQAVNRAYMAGIAIFAAAGNRIGCSLPSTMVYPARFGRVVAVCGATAQKSPYYRPGLHRKMQGCFGPASAMNSAIAAYTPNVPWAMMGCSSLITYDGGGTSSATPQAAAAAALWLQQANLSSASMKWQHVEAVRFALFSSADADVPDCATYFGHGLLRARHALDVPFQHGLRITPPDEVSFPWLRLANVLEATEPIDGRERMYEVEALQVFHQSLEAQQIAGGADPDTDTLDRPTQKRLVATLRDASISSQALRRYLAELHDRL